jgi:hypothetical protein
LSVANGKCSNCGAISVENSGHSTEVVIKNEDGFPREPHEWHTPNVTIVDVFNVGASLFILLWVVAFVVGTNASWGEKIPIALVGLLGILFCLFAVVGSARVTVINPDGSVIFERNRLRPKRMIVKAGELSSITGSLMDINRFRPMTVRKGEVSMSYIPPREDAIEIFRMIVAANPRAWVSNPTPTIGREQL